MYNYTKKVFVGAQIDLRPLIIEAKAILAVPDRSKRKSEFRVIQETNLGHAANPENEPRMFIECKVADGSWVDDWIFDVETHTRYESIQGHAKNETRVYLKEIKNQRYTERVLEVTNLEQVKEMVLGNAFSEDES